MKMIEALPTVSERGKHYLRRLACLPLILLTACAVQPPQPSSTPAPASVAEAAAATAEIDLEPPEPAIAATPDRIATLQKWVDQHNRLYAIAAPLLIENTELCKRHVRPLLGFTAKNRFSYSNRFSDVARAALGLGERLRVMSVLPGSGAAQAGLKKGDTLVAIDGKPLPEGPRAERITAMQLAKAMRGRDSFELTVVRDAQRMKLRIPFTPACAFGVEFGNGEHVNSYADGYRVMLTRGMLSFARSDDEVAYVLAKEIAQNIVAPAPRADMGSVIDRLRQVDVDPVRGETGLAPYSPVLDATADKLALYMLARAGYSIEPTIAFWQRLAKRYPERVADGHTALHPSTNYRVSVMSEVAKRIAFKQANKLPLLP